MEARTVVREKQKRDVSRQKRGRHSQLINNERRYKNWKESIPTLQGTDEAYGEDDQFAFRQQSVVSNSQVKYISLSFR